MSVSWTPGQFILRVEQGGYEGVITAIGIVEDRWVKSIMGPPKSGEVYTTRFFTIGQGAGRIVVPYGSRPAHQASAAGEYPASDSGRLVNSRRIEYHTGERRASMIVAAKYALHLEYGTDRMEPRPHLRRALAESRDEITAAIATSIANKVRSQ